MVKVLIVEDNEMNLDMLSRRLTRRGYDVVAAIDGLAGVEAAKRERPDIVLMDMSLPELDGFEATRRVKAAPESSFIPVLALTAHALSEDRERCLAAGCDDFDTKPVQIDRLVNKIEALIERTRHQRPPDPEPPPVVETPKVAPARVLVIDDNEANRILLSRRLEKEGYVVTCVNDGQEGLDTLANSAFDLVLCDIMMPKLNGFEVLERIKGAEELRHLPVIMISALDEMKGIVRAIEMGAEDYLPKPFDPVLLRARIEASLERKRWRDRERLYLHKIEEEQRRADELLQVILPPGVVQELKRTNGVAPRRHDNVAVLFCDIVGFTAYCDRTAPDEVLRGLQPLVEVYEDLTVKHHLQKIKTIGDAYMATSGLLSGSDNPVLDCVRCGLDMVENAKKHGPGWSVRVGIHVGPVISGIVGRRQYLFDIWGDTVNIAARVESLGQQDHVNLSATAWDRVQHVCFGQSAGTVVAKGKGTIELYTVTSCVT